MNKRFEIILLGEVWDVLNELDEKVKEKILYNIEKSKFVNDPELFKKIDDDIWEFRTRYRRSQYRLLSFWDKQDKTETLVVATHGFVKKTEKIPLNQIDKTKEIMKIYFEQKDNKKDNEKLRRTKDVHFRPSKR